MIERKEILQKLMEMQDVEELKLIARCVRDRIDEIGGRIKYSLKPNDRVIITSKKGTEHGSIRKVNRTRAVVNIKGTLYNVPFSMITLDVEGI